MPGEPTFTQYESQSVLKEHLRTTRAKTVLIGDEVEAPREFYCISLPATPGSQTEVGLISAGFGIGPAAHVLAGGEVLRIDMLNGKVSVQEDGMNG